MRTIIVFIFFVWAGVVVGISFLEAPLKFKAPNVTKEIGLGIGRVVFSAMNKLEWIFLLILFFCIIWIFKNNIPYLSFFLFGLLIAVLILQTIFLNYLNIRVEKILSGQKISSSYLHFFYVLLEGLKFILLLYLSVFGNIPCKLGKRTSVSIITRESEVNQYIQTTIAVTIH